MTQSHDSGHRRHVFRELGFATTMVGDELHGAATITPHMHVPGTTRLRTSILAAWTDSVTGLLASLALRPRVPVTLDLDIQLTCPAPSAGQVRVLGRTVKTGRTVFVAAVEFQCDGKFFGFGTASFMASPNRTLQVPERLSIGLPPSPARLQVPLAQRVGCRHREPGTVLLPRSEDGLNFSHTISGGLIALAAEEAALSLAPGRTLCALALRYLQPARTGPIIATATLAHDLGRISLHDAGNANRLTTRATVRLFGE
ncbi:hotdog domain-containing protein [Nocardia alni]|uniref:hotdog domain-containing protein n=1 Tax=Nocardia alni TaxID=2815723 RepID=UPI001C2435DB|nr:hotdog domain-containing protein [Nocardia alni]